MEITLDHALQKGVEAHKAGKVEEADQYYTAILKANPKHPDANHNMGVLAVGVGKVEAALPFFKTALEANPNNAQYWLSYIDALIKLDRMTDAKEVFDQAKSKGAKGDGFDKIEKKICATPVGNINSDEKKISSLTKSINSLYANQRPAILNNAVAGWLYNIRYDQDFLTTDSVEDERGPKDWIAETCPNLHKKHHYIHKDIATTLTTVVADLNETLCIKEKFKKLEALNYSDNRTLLEDSFTGDKSVDFTYVQKSTFTEDELSVVIIGAGPCGLYLANALKHELRKKINILVVDNHCLQPHVKKRFSRRWLTQLPIKHFDKYFDPALRKLATGFGKDGYIGLPINCIEVLLLISAKILGVNFYFDRKVDLSVLNKSLVDLVFDASGGRIPTTKHQRPLEQEITIRIPNHRMDVSFAGIKNLPVKNLGSSDEILVTLKEDGYYHYPHFNSTGLFLPMMKLTQVPVSLHPSLIKFVQKLRNNRFYIWRGTLVDEINELLILINLKTAEYDYLKPLVRNMQKLRIDLMEKGIENQLLGADLVEFLKICAAYENAPIYINSPFVSKAAVNLKPLDQRINGIEVHPVGDSLFQGNPKVGNGLNNHLKQITNLVQVITRHQK